MPEIFNPLPRINDRMFKEVKGVLERQWYSFFQKLSLLQGDNGNGATADRPTIPIIYKQYFDTDLGYAVWWDGSDWVDATGAAV